MIPESEVYLDMPTTPKKVFPYKAMFVITASLLAIVLAFNLIGIDDFLTTPEEFEHTYPAYNYTFNPSTDLIQQAIWDLNDTSGVIYLSEGTYYINNTVRVPNGTIIVGDKVPLMEGLEIKDQEIGLIVNSNNTIIRNLQILNCTIGIYLTENVKNCIITDCFIGNVGYGIVADNSSTIRLSYNYIGFYEGAFMLSGTDYVLNENNIFKLNNKATH